MDAGIIDWYIVGWGECILHVSRVEFLGATELNTMDLPFHQKRDFEVLTSGTLECDLIWK